MPQGDLASVVAELRELIAELRATISELNESVAARNERIAELEKLLEASRRSGKRQSAPFSKGQSSTDPAKPGRKSGEEHGRHGHRAQPVTRPDRELEAALPGCCPDCGGAVEVERETEQFQVDLPPIVPIVTRFKIQIGHCRQCRRRVQGRHPDQASDALGAASQVGPIAKAWSHYLHYGLGLSFGKCAVLLRRLGIEVTAGALSQAAQSTGADLVPVQAEIMRRLNGAPVVTADETGWRVGGGPAWLWVATAEGLTVYNVAGGRGYDEACEILGGDYDGVLVRDGWAPYRRYENATHQSCTAHFLRRCNEMIDDNPAWARGNTPPGQGHAPRRARRPGPNRQAPQGSRRRSRRPDRTPRRAGPSLRRQPSAGRSPPQGASRSLHFPGPTRCARHELESGTSYRRRGERNRTWRGAATQSRMMTLLRTAAQQGVDAIDWLAAFARAPGLTATTLFAQ